jgi:ceramide glucosyltransferase
MDLVCNLSIGENKESVLNIWIMSGLLLIQWISCIIATCHLIMLSRKTTATFKDFPTFTIVRPLHGNDYNTANNIYSTTTIEYPNYKNIFCFETAEDLALPSVYSCINYKNANRNKILIGYAAQFKNPKLANLAKSLPELDTDYVAFVDSNVLLKNNYLTSVLNIFSQTNAAVISAPPLAIEMKNLVACVEGAFLNTHQIRWQYVANFFGSTFAQGKNLILSTKFFKEIGGFEALDQVAEDAALTKLVRKNKQKMTLLYPTFTPLGPRKFADVWKRQLRWSKLRRITFCKEFLPEILLGILPFIISLYFCKFTLSTNLTLVCLFYAAEYYMALILSWPTSIGYILGCVIRDFLMPAIWCVSWFGKTIDWNGKIILVN